MAYDYSAVSLLSVLFL